MLEPMSLKITMINTLHNLYFYFTTCTQVVVMGKNLVNILVTSVDNYEAANKSFEHLKMSPQEALNFD